MAGHALLSGRYCRVVPPRWRRCHGPLRAAWPIGLASAALAGSAWGAGISPATAATSQGGQTSPAVGTGPAAVTKPAVGSEQAAVRKPPAVTKQTASTRAAAGAGAPGGQAGQGAVSLRISSLYGVSVAPGSWVPVEISVGNDGASNLAGELVVTSPVQGLSGGVPYCFSSGATTSCIGVGIFPGSRTFAYTFGGFGPGFSSSYSQGAPISDVTYELPFDLAPSTTKTLTIDVLAAAAPSALHVKAVSASGKVLADASATVQVANSATAPSVLVVTNNQTALSSLQWPVPAGPLSQLQFLSPAEVPATSGALGAFSAIVIDQADTSVLSQAQREALTCYVQEGGTLFIAGGLAWASDVAGLPGDLVPAKVLGTEALALGTLGQLVGARAPSRATIVDRLRPKAGSTTVLSQGRAPLVLQLALGSGDVVLSAFDPASPPLAGWAGGSALNGRLLAPAYQSSFDSSGQVVFASKGFITAPGSPASLLGSTPGAVSPQVAGGALAPFLFQVPGASLPKPQVLGFLLLGYILVAGPLAFLLLRKLQRGELAWAALPALALAATAVAYTTGAGMSRSPLADEVQVARVTAGSRLAEVMSLGAVYLPAGGTGTVAVAGGALASDLGAGAGANLTIDATKGPDQVSLKVRGPANTLGGWAAEHDALLPGTLLAHLVSSGDSVSGSVTNELGVALRDVYVLSSTGQQRVFGTVPAGATLSFSFPLPSASTGSGQGPVVVPLFLVGGSQHATQGQPRLQAAEQGLSELATDYSSADGGWPVLVGIAERPFLPLSRSERSMPLASTEAVVAPLLPSLAPGTRVTGLQPELVGAQGVTGAVSLGPAGGTLTLANSGSLYYQFTLPGGRWRDLLLNLGSPNGSAPGPGFATNFGTVAGFGLASGTSPVTAHDFALSAFNYGESRWQRLPIFTASSSLVGGNFQASIPDPAPFLGPGGDLELRLSSDVSGLQVFGPIPTLSVRPAS